MRAGMMTTDNKPRVLVLAADELTLAVRLGPLLDALVELDAIAGYEVVDRDLSVRGARAGRFDVILAQRNPSTRQAAWLRRSRLPFAYDIDDLLLEPAEAELRRRQRRERAVIAWALRQAAVVTTPTLRLRDSLEERHPTGLAERYVQLPNPGFTIGPSTRLDGPPRFIWVSSAAPISGAELDTVCTGIEAACRDTGIGITLVGRFPPEILSRFSRVTHVPWVTPEAFAAFLRAEPFLAVCPLGTTLPERMQTFLDAKSDIKAAQFASLGIAGAYAPAASFRESDLPIHLVAANEAEAWRSALVELVRDFPSEGLSLAAHPRVLARRPKVLAETLLAALLRARVSEPFPFDALPTPRLFRAIDQRLRRWRRALLGRKPAPSGHSAASIPVEPSRAPR